MLGKYTKAIISGAGSVAALGVAFGLVTQGEADQLLEHVDAMAAAAAIIAAKVAAVIALRNG